MTADHNPLGLDNQLCFAAYSTAHAFNRLYRQHLSALGLTYPQYLVLLVLWENAPVPVKAIGDRLMLDSGTLTPLLKRMEMMGLIIRERASHDERQVLVRPSTAGLALKDRARALPPAIACATGLDPESLGRMVEDLQTLRTRLLANAQPE